MRALGTLVLMVSFIFIHLDSSILELYSIGISLHRLMGVTLQRRGHMPYVEELEISLV